GDLRLALRHARFEQLLDARQTAGDVQTTGDAAEVEGAHRQLRARLTDRLCRDDADRLALLDHMAAGQAASVAQPAETAFRIAGQRRTDVDLHAQIVLAGRLRHSLAPQLLDLNPLGD